MRVAAAHAAHAYPGVCRASSHGSGGQRRSALSRASTRPTSANPHLSRAGLGRRETASREAGRYATGFEWAAGGAVGRRAAAAVLVRAEADEKARGDDADVIEGVCERERRREGQPRLRGYCRLPLHIRELVGWRW
jgi:hypothetical protein